MLVQEVLDELRRICDKLGARALFIVRGISVLGIRAGLSFHSREQLAADYRTLALFKLCLLYTSDAADDRLAV